MHFEIYEKFKTLKAAGKKSEATATLEEFIKSLNSDEEKCKFVDWFFNNDFNGKKIRHELFEHVIFPVLNKGRKNSNPTAILRLSKTEYNWPQVVCLDSELEDIGIIDLQHQYLELCPHDDAVRLELVDSYISFFNLCQHEWPAGILYGPNGATEEECGKLLNDAKIAKELDQEEKHCQFFNEFINRVLQYGTRLEENCR